MTPLEHPSTIFIAGRATAAAVHEHMVVYKKQIMGHPVWRGPSVAKKRVKPLEVDGLPRLTGSRSLPTLARVDVCDDWRESRPGPLASAEYPNFAGPAHAAGRIDSVLQDKAIRDALISSELHGEHVALPSSQTEADGLIRDKVLPVLSEGGVTSSSAADAGNRASSAAAGSRAWYSYAPPPASATPLRLSQKALVEERTALFVRVRRVWRASYVAREHFRKAFVKHKLASSMIQYARQLVAESKGIEESELAAMRGLSASSARVGRRGAIAQPLPKKWRRQLAGRRDGEGHDRGEEEEGEEGEVEEEGGGGEEREEREEREEGDGRSDDGDEAEETRRRAGRLLSLERAGGPIPRNGPELDALQPKNWGRPGRTGELASYWGPDIEDQTGWKSPWRQPPHPSHRRPMRHPGEEPAARAAKVKAAAARRAAEARHDDFLSEWERLAALARPLTQNSLAQTGRRCIQAAERMRLRPRKDWDAPLPTRQSLAEVSTWELTPEEAAARSPFESQGRGRIRIRIPRIPPTFPTSFPLANPNGLLARTDSTLSPISIHATGARVTYRAAPCFVVVFLFLRRPHSALKRFTRWPRRRPRRPLMLSSAPRARSRPMPSPPLWRL